MSKNTPGSPVLNVCQKKLLCTCTLHVEISIRCLLKIRGLCIMDALKQTFPPEAQSDLSGETVIQLRWPL